MGVEVPKLYPSSRGSLYPVKIIHRDTKAQLSCLNFGLLWGHIWPLEYLVGSAKISVATESYFNFYLYSIRLLLLYYSPPVNLLGTISISNSVCWRFPLRRICSKHVPSKQTLTWDFGAESPASWLAMRILSIVLDRVLTASGKT